MSDELTTRVFAGVERMIAAACKATLARVEKLIEGIPSGPKGEKGDPGDRGSDGMPGRDGLTIQGPIGERGERGIDGRDGRDGKDGKDGKDSDVTRAELEKLVHDGVNKAVGLILRSIEVEGRTLKIGGVVLQNWPVPIYRGVFRQGDPYEHGDMVSFGGSVWHCNAVTDEKPGDGSKSWTLAAKRGRDGKDK